MLGLQHTSSMLLYISANSEAPHTCTAVLVISRGRQLSSCVCSACCSPTSSLCLNRYLSPCWGRWAPQLHRPSEQPAHQRSTSSTAKASRPAGRLLTGSVLQTSGLKLLVFLFNGVQGLLTIHQVHRTSSVLLFLTKQLSCQVYRL